MKKFLLITGLLSLIVSVSFGANRYWVSTGSSTWNSSANWSTTSGGAGGSSVPGSADVARFDNAKNGNCTIDINVSVLGMVITTYSGTISQGAHTLTIGTSDYNQASGTFTGGSSDITLSGATYTLSGGTFTSTSGNLDVQSTFTQSGGTFNHNNGTVTFDGSTNQTFNVNSEITFYNVLINKTGASNANCLNINTADTMTVANLLTVTDGRCYTAGYVKILKNYQHDATDVPSTSFLIFAGSGNNNYIVNNNPEYAGEIIRKNALTDTVKFTRNTAGNTVTDGYNTGTVGLTITKGTAYMSPLYNADLNYDNISIAVRGKLVGTPNLMSIDGDWTNTAGGSFVHKNGTVSFDNTTAAQNIDVNSTETFYNLTLNKTSANSTNYTLNVAAGDNLYATNKLTITTGRFSGAGGINTTLYAKDSVVMNGTRDQLAGIVLYGSGNNHYILNYNPKWTDFTINKTNNTDTVKITRTAAGGIVEGTASASTNNAFTITKGTVTFDATKDVQWDYSPFTISANGVFVAPSRAMIFSGSYTNNGGRFMHNTGKWTFYGRNTSRSYTTTSHMDTFYRCQVNYNRNDANNDFTIAATDSILSADTFWMTDGQLRGGAVVVMKNMYATQANACPATLIFSGPSDGFINFTGSTSIWDGNVKIRKSSSDNYMTLSSPLILNANTGTGNSLYMLNGKLSTSATNYLRFGTYATNTFATGSVNSFVEGPIQKQINTNGATTFPFYIGKNRDFARIDLTTTHSNASTYTYTTTYYEANSSLLGQTKPAGIVNTGANAYWSIARSSATTGLTSASVKIYYTVYNGVVTAANIRVLKSQASNTWLNLGGSGSANIAGNITSSTFNTFASIYFTLGSTGLNPLPVELTTFNANLIGKNVELTWTTSSEMDNDYFSVQKSNDGVNFTEIAKVRGMGNSNDNVNYNYTDASPFIGTSFYRLKQVDYNGKFEYSPTVRVYSPVMTDESKITSYPNPAKDVLNLNILTYQNDNNATINIYNISGQVVMTNTASLQKGGNKVALDLNNLSHGFYMIRVTGDNAYPDQVVKFIKE